MRLTDSGRQPVSGLPIQAEIHERMVRASRGTRKSEAPKAALRESIDGDSPID